jgi:hypothetical protein
VAKRATVYGRTAKEAREKAAGVRARVRAQMPVKDRKVTVSDFTLEWIDSTLAASDRKATTKAMYTTVARKHIVAAKIGALSMDKLRPTQVDSWKVELQGRGLSDSNIRSAYTILRAILDSAVRDGALARNPAAAVTRPEGESSRSRIPGARSGARAACRCRVEPVCASVRAPGQHWTQTR